MYHIVERISYDLPLLVQHEPLFQSMGVTQSIIFEHYYRWAVSQGTSIMAIDTANGNKIVGVRAHRVERRCVPSDPLTVPDGVDDPPGAAVSKLVELCYDRWNPWDKSDVDSFLYFKFLAVHKDYRGQGVSVKMMDATFEFMRSHGIPLAYVWACSFYSQNVFRQLGFETVDQINYEEYVVDGSVVFRPEKPHVSCNTMVKWLE